MDLQNKTVVLTGATGGIGQAVAQLLEQRGANLVLVARHQQALETLRESLKRPESHAVCAADVTDGEQRENLLHFLRYGLDDHGIDVVINNAGTNQFSLLSQRSPSSVEHEIALNLNAPILLTQGMLSWINRPGIILNIGSTLGAIGYPGYSTYCAAKSGVQRFSEALDRELDGSGIRVLFLAPRTTDTRLNNDVVQEMNRALGNHSDSVDVVAKHVVKVIEDEIASLWIGWPEKLFVRINQLVPNVVSKSIRKQQATIHQFISNRKKHV